MVKKIKNKKSGYFGNKIWQAHRLEEDEKKIAIRPIKKPKKKVNKK